MKHNVSLLSRSLNRVQLVEEVSINAENEITSKGEKPACQHLPVLMEEDWDVPATMSICLMSLADATSS